MDVAIVVGKVSTPTIQIRTSFALIVPMFFKSSNLGFMFILSIHDFSRYRSLFLKPQASSCSTSKALQNAHHNSSNLEFRKNSKPGNAEVNPMLLELHSSKQQQQRDKEGDWRARIQLLPLLVSTIRICH